MLLKRSHCKPLLGAFLTAFAAATATPAHAANNDAVLELLRVLKEKGTIDAATYEQLRGVAQVESEQTTKEADDLKKSTEKAVKDLPVVDAKKFKICSSDKNFCWKVGGRIHFDYTNPDNSTGKIVNGATVIRTPTNFEEKAAFRRVRLQAEGTVFKDWDIKVQYDFADTGGSIAQGIRDAYIKYNFKVLGDNPAWLAFGQYNEYITLEEQTSSNDFTFIERAQMSQAFDATNGRRAGVGADVVWKDMLMTQVGLFGRELGQAQGTPGAGADVTDALRVTGRAVFAPWHTKERVLHLGGAFSYISDFDNHALTPVPNARPDFDTGGGSTRPFNGFTTIPTGVACTGNGAALPAGCATGGWRYAAEGAFDYGPFSVQGEWQQVDVDRSSGALGGGGAGNGANINSKTLSFDGWYVMGSWIITGESRNYDLAEGKFKNPTVANPFGKGGWGAWEVAARYDELNLFDKNLNTCNLTTAANFCGESDIVTVGLTWYPNDIIRFMANYVDVVDFKHGKFGGMDPSAFILRASAAF